MSTTLEKRRRTALHEAGHVVVGRAAGFDVRKVEVYEDGGGKCFVVATERTSLEDVQRELSYTIAGRMAVALEADEPLYMLTLPLSLRDIVDKERIPDWPGSETRGFAGFRRSVAELLYGRQPEAEAWLDQQLPVIADETERVLRARWSEVIDLATRLMKYETVDLRSERAEAKSSRRIQGLTRTKPSVGRASPVEIAACLRFLSNYPGASDPKVKKLLDTAGLTEVYG